VTGATCAVAILCLLVLRLVVMPENKDRPLPLVGAAGRDLEPDT
jgi:hypothetical protein